MRRLARAAAPLAVLAGALVLGAAGCRNVGAPPANRPPDTFLAPGYPDSVVEGSSGDAHVVLYRERMHWWGTDTDGNVTGYEWRFVLLDDASLPTDSTGWGFTTRTDSLFDFPAAEARVRRRFDVRAIDDAGLRDPVPATQQVVLRNEPPTATFNRVLFPATSLPALTVFWSGRDVDGVETLARYHVWLQGTDEASGITVTAPESSATLTPAMLAGASGPRTVYVRAIDTGGLGGPPDSMTWQVNEKQGDLLLIDDYPGDQPANFQIDAFYTGALDSVPGPGNYTVYTVDQLGAFRSADEADALFGIFRQIVWYRDDFRGIFAGSTALRTAETGLVNHLARGGGAFLSSPVAVGSVWSLSTGSLEASGRLFLAGGFAQQAAGVSAFHVAFPEGSVSSTNFTLSAPSGDLHALEGNPAAGTGAIAIGVSPGVPNPSTILGVECLVPDSALAAAGVVRTLWSVAPHELDAQEIGRDQSEPFPVAVLSTAGGGPLVLMTAPMSLFDYSGNARAEFVAVLRQVGLAP